MVGQHDANLRLGRQAVPQPIGQFAGRLDARQAGADDERRDRARAVAAAAEVGNSLVQALGVPISVDASAMLSQAGNLRPAKLAAGRQHQPIVRQPLRKAAELDFEFSPIEINAHHAAFDPPYADRRQHLSERHSHLAQIGFVESHADAVVRVGIDQHDFDLFRADA